MPQVRQVLGEEMDRMRPIPQYQERREAGKNRERLHCPLAESREVETIYAPRYDKDPSAQVWQKTTGAFSFRDKAGLENENIVCGPKTSYLPRSYTVGKT